MKTGIQKQQKEKMDPRFRGDDKQRNMFKIILLALIRLYQKTLSPDHGIMRFFVRRGVCIYRPTCSEYAYEAIERFGVIKGIWFGAKRLARCHPWHVSEYDPVTE